MVSSRPGLWSLDDVQMAGTSQSRSVHYNRQSYVQPGYYHAYHPRTEQSIQTASDLDEDCVVFRLDGRSRFASRSPSHPPHDWVLLHCCSRSTLGDGLLPVEATRLATH